MASLLLLLLMQLAVPAADATTDDGTRVGGGTVTPEQFGAVGDGKHDDTVPMRAALASCKFSHPGAAPCTVLLVRNYSTGPLLINSSAITLRVTGQLAMLPRAVYPKGPTHFISTTAGLKQLRIDGGGLITGLGAAWWPCKQSGCWRPHLMSFGGVAGLEIGPLRMSDPPNHFIECSGCSQVRVHDLVATAPNNSPNTDGMNFYGGEDQSIVDSVIENGDDCISVVPTGDPASPLCVNHPEQCHGGSLLVHNVTCIGGHGLSIGSVRHGVVRNVTFSSCVMTREKHSTQVSSDGQGPVNLLPCPPSHTAPVTPNRPPPLHTTNPATLVYM